MRKQEISPASDYSSSESSNETSEEDEPTTPVQEKRSDIPDSSPLDGDLSPEQVVHKPRSKKKRVSFSPEKEVHYPPVRKKPKKLKKPEMIPTSDPNVTMQVKSRSKGPKPKKIYVYREDLPQNKIQIIEKSKKRGRPKTKLDVEIVKDNASKVNAETIVIDRPSDQKKTLTARELKRMELDARFSELEQMAGKKLRQTKKGTVDKRSAKERTPKQIEASRRLVEFNKEMKNRKKQEERKADLKDVIGELARVKETVKQSQPHNADDDLFM